ncbi:MAG: APC family permease [Coriobacteriales bacterium]|jgi:amino acid transporter|nr:APC family permease [Coriobacteriales bacterium]
MATGETNNPKRTLRWWHGLEIALGVPVFILPSISTFSGMIGAFAIIIWMFSVFQGFMQTVAYGELASRYPNCNGLPGFTQAVFSQGSKREYGFGKFIGGLCAWSYLFTWSAVLSVFSVLIGHYLIGLIPALGDYAALYPWFSKVFSLCVGAVVFSTLILINHRGIGGGAIAGWILAVVSLIPLFIISIAGIFSGHFEITNITHHWFPSEWSWDFNGIILFVGILALAQWSACGFEAAALYAPHYKKPRKDIPKALFGCGIVCIFSYFLVQFSATGALGVDGIAANVNDPMLALAKLSMGNVGAIISIVMLLAAMVMIIQTAMYSGSMAMASMADEGNLQKVFGKRNRHGAPWVAMITVSLFNLVLIALGDSAASLLAAAAIGYVVANGLGLFAFVKARIDLKKEKWEETKARENVVADEDIFHAPKAWFVVALVFGILQLPLYIVGTTYLNMQDYGLIAASMAFVILLIFVPLWFLARATNMKKSKKAKEKSMADEGKPA